MGLVDGTREPRLHISNGEYGPYIALSYCWGSTNPAVTTRHNLKERVKEIPFSDLPRTVHDAITVTRRLGIRFLWVDVLCIAQDSINGEDWVHESSRMADIYGNAYLTIVDLPRAEAGTKNIIIQSSMDNFCLSRRIYSRVLGDLLGEDWLDCDRLRSGSINL